MRTHFRAEQLADPSLAEAEKNLRACVHCGICTATCPTYVLLGDERDSPRGRIVMMQKMLEAGGAPSHEAVTHLDRCLSCLGCKTACPSGVDYARLIDQSRAHIERHYRRPPGERLFRWGIANMLTRPSLTRIALGLARFFSPLTPLLPGRLRAMASKAKFQHSLSSPVYGGGVARSEARESVFARESGETVGGISRNIALLPGCVQQVIAPEIDAAAVRVLARRGCSLVPLNGAGCCGALAFHLGRGDEAKMWAKRLIEAFEAASKSKSFENILITATGCAAHIADYPHLFRDDPSWHPRAEAFASHLVQLQALLSSPACGGGGSPRSGETVGGAVADPPSASLTAFARHLPRERGRIRVALQVPCSQQHGLRAPDDGDLLRAAGYDVLAIPESHLCCGSAGSYSLLQPEIAAALRERKLAHIATVKPDIIATSNIGCLQHLSGIDAPPVVHVAQLLDWADGGPVPRRLAAHAGLMARADANV
jgi:glycolate oxidase iron-sulfur subunit